VNGLDYSGTAPIQYTANVIRGAATLDDDRYPYSGQEVSDGWTDTYQDSYTCSRDVNDYNSSGENLNNQVVNTAEVWSDGELEDSSTATTEIDCYIPLISKLAAGTYDERHEWDVEKTVNPLAQAAFAGGTVYFDWTIVVTEEVFEENFDVAGTITVTNPNGEDELVVPLTDVMNGDVATIDQGSCDFDGTYLTVAAGGSETCNYAANDLPYDDVGNAPTVNMATISLNGIDYVATDPIEYAANVIRGTATLDDDQYPYSGESVDDGWTSTYADSYTCSSDLNDYTNGMDLDNLVNNTAIVYSESEEQDRSTATTEIDCYTVSIDKDASTTYTRTYDWTIDKSVDIDSWNLFKGDSGESKYTISVTKDNGTDSAWAVSGSIDITNPAPMAVSIEGVTDVISPDIVPTLDCGVTFPYSLAGGGTLTCAYSSLLPDAASRVNTATVTVNGVATVATANVTFGAPTSLVNDSIHVDDVYTAPDSGGATFGPTGSSTSWDYNRTFACDADEGGHNNVATIRETEVWDDADVTVACYDLAVSKAPDPYVPGRCYWTVDKKVDGQDDPIYLTLAEGQQYIGMPYTVAYDLEHNPDAFRDSDDRCGTPTLELPDTYPGHGTIWVSNPAPIPATLVEVIDELAGASDINVTCPSLTIPAGGLLECAYTANVPVDTPELMNYGKAVLQNTAYLQSGPVAAGTTTYTSDGVMLEMVAQLELLINRCAVVTDTWGPSTVGGEICIPTLFEYAIDFPREGWVCNEETNHPNTADFTGIDHAEFPEYGSDTVEVNVLVECEEGCTLTQGYWKTHSECGPAPYDDNWTNIFPELWGVDAEGNDVLIHGDWSSYFPTAMGLGDGECGTGNSGAETPFWFDGSWIDVFWTPGEGDVCYNLAHQYQAAILNVLNEASSTEVDPYFADAELILSGQCTTGGLSNKTVKGDAALKEMRAYAIFLAGKFAAYNEGDIGPGHCDEDQLTDNSID
jgi:hypothetical protein